jgi:uncharacterized protein (DUF1015 family)
VAVVRPFSALRYTPAAGALGDLVAPPYDVISPDERLGYLEVSPHNSVRLILPELEYDEVGALIAEWVRDGVIGRADQPGIIAWTQTFRLADGIERERRTLLAAVGIEPYETRVVRPHERTHSGPKADRLRLTRAVQTNLSPVFGLYPDSDGTAWAAAAVGGAPEAEFVDVDGTVHRIWWIDEPAACAAVTAAMADRWILIADGHHRYETAVGFQAERRAEVGDDLPHAFDNVMMGLTALDDPGLVVLPTHRLLAEWPDAAGSRLTSTAVADFDALMAALAAAPEDAFAAGLVRPTGAVLLTGPPHTDPSPAARLDVAVIESEVLVPDLGADQAALAARGTLTYTKDPREAFDMASSGAVQAAFVLRPIPKASVAAVADAAETMPQKSTYFFPKLLTGVAFHSLVDG